MTSGHSRKAALRDDWADNEDSLLFLTKICRYEQSRDRSDRDCSWERGQGSEQRSGLRRCEPARRGSADVNKCEMRILEKEVDRATSLARPMKTDVSFSSSTEICRIEANSKSSQKSFSQRMSATISSGSKTGRPMRRDTGWCRS
jgi:hypothetical protein